MDIHFKAIVCQDGLGTKETQTELKHKFCGFSALQAEIERAKREKEALTLTVSSSVAEKARQEVALMADRPYLQEAQEVLVDWIGERSATQQANQKAARDVKERSAEAEAMIAAIERVVWEALCDNGNRSSASTQKAEQAQAEEEEDKRTEMDRNSDTVGEQLATVLGAAPDSGGIGGALALREYGKEEVGGLWKDHSSQHDQKEELQLQEEHQDSSRLIARRPMAFLVPGVLAGLASGLSGAWVILVDQELQSERLGAGNALFSAIFFNEKR
eukprot:COSAG06_NODE_818_length_12113_cov_9.211670_9_plen_273_part_00